MKGKKVGPLDVMIMQIFGPPVPLFVWSSKKTGSSPLLLTHSFNSISFTIEQFYYIFPLIDAKCDFFTQQHYDFENMGDGSEDYENMVK